ncbi:glycoside hydrolase family 108 protein [Zhengella sp. ZM62]|uniref:glycoside hydrolase family 108 protein n=1 Tax=Zhengella sedimenti TaxID=3390035 RepID=UPI003974A04E
MTDRNFARALPLVLKHEGGYVDHPNDPGGATNKGVTLATFRRYVKADGTKADLRAITDKQVATVYYRHYWSAVNAQALPAGLDYAVFDFAVNSGPSRAAQFLQRVLGVTVDGRVGPKTIEAAEKADARATIKALCEMRLAWLKRLKHWPTFGRGWTRRVNDVERDALAMVGRPADIKTVEKTIEKPVVPPAVEETVKKKTGFWGWLTGLGGGAGAGAAGLLGADWQTVAVLAGAVIVLLVVIVILRTRIAAAVREISDAVGGE